MLPLLNLERTAMLTMLQIRLTFNYWRKGGYQIGSEDYRWFVKLHPKTLPTLTSI